MKNSKFDTAFIDLEGTDLLSSPVIDYGKFYRALQICNMVVITNFLIDGVKQPSIPVELEKDDDDYIIFYLTHYKVVIGDEEVTVSEVQTTAELKNEITGTGITNAKPLYFHPITIIRASYYTFSIIIINNSSEAYTKTTLPAELNRIKNLAEGTARFPATGSFLKETIIVPSYNLEVIAEDTFKIYGFNGTDTVNIDINFSNVTNVFDGVNKIN